MKLGSLQSENNLDGELVIVSRDNKKAVKATSIVPSLREAIEKWDSVSSELTKLYDKLLSDQCDDAFEVNESDFHSPLPRTFQWADGSAFIHHIKLVRMSRNAPLPETLESVPLMYQGGGDDFLAPNQDVEQVDFSHGTDFEGEVGVIVGDVPMGVTPEEALKCIRLFVIINDVSLRGLIPEELKQGFGFFHGKPSSAFAPFAITADELGDAYKEGRICLPLMVKYNDEEFGRANAKEMFFHFGELIAHAAKTRRLKAGAIIGSGTVSNEDSSVGSSCILERRMLEKLNEGVIKTPFMKVGDKVEVEMFDKEGQSLFGKIKQQVVQATHS